MFAQPNQKRLNAAGQLAESLLRKLHDSSKTICGLQGFRTLGKYREISLVGEDAVARATGLFLDDAEVNQPAKRRVHGDERRRVFEEQSRAFDRKHRLPLQELVHARDRWRGTCLEDSALIFLEKTENPSRRVCSLIGGGSNTFEEKGQPLFPHTFCSHALEQLVVFFAVLLEEEAEVEQRLL